MIHYIYAEDMDIDKLFVEMISQKSMNSDFIVDNNEKGSLNLVSALLQQYRNEKEANEKDLDESEYDIDR